MVVLVWIVFLVISEECIQVYTLLEILYGFEASKMFQEFKVSVNIKACSDESVPVDTL